VINKSLAFTARMTSYRNVRFNFGGTYWGAAGVFLGMPILAAMSGGLLAPLSSQMSSNYLGKHTGFGSARFATDAPVPALFANLGMTIVFTLVIASILGAIGAALGGGIAALAPLVTGSGDQFDVQALTIAILIPTLIGVYASIFLAYIFYAAGVRNIAFNATTLDGRHRLRSTVGRLRYTWILVSNLFATLFTLLMLRPWAAVRTWRYLAASTGLLVAGSLDEIVEAAGEEGNVAAAEFFDIEGIDFGL
jgi:uncharacterized membrane protein YjgN (DUF898 family)